MTAFGSQFSRAHRALLSLRDECAEGLDGSLTKCLAPFRKFHYIQATFASFDLRDERLRVPDPIGEIGLGDPALLPEIAQEFEENLIVLMVCRLGHAVAGCWHRTLESVME
jgi:hypothetical protein